MKTRGMGTYWEFWEGQRQGRAGGDVGRLRTRMLKSYPLTLLWDTSVCWIGAGHSPGPPAVSPEGEVASLHPRGSLPGHDGPAHSYQGEQKMNGIKNSLWESTHRSPVDWYSTFWQVCSFPKFDFRPKGTKGILNLKVRNFTNHRGLKSENKKI